MALRQHLSNTCTHAAALIQSAAARQNKQSIDQLNLDIW